MDWKTYETEIHEMLQEMYPDASMQHDAKIVGRYSNTKRQIDILIEDEIAGFPVKIAVDTKFFSKRIDVKCVECFLSMMDDVEVTQGLLITTEGYSDAALCRANNDPRKLELDVLKFDPLKKFQCFEALPYSGPFGITLFAPFGWVVDMNSQNVGATCLVPRGKSIEQAQVANEWMYLNFWHKEDGVTTIDELLKFQEETTFSSYHDVEILERRASKRKDGKSTYIRSVTARELPGVELTGFIEHDTFIAYVVCHCNKDCENKNTRKINYILNYASPFVMSIDNSKLIEGLKEQIEACNDDKEKSNIAFEIAHRFREEGDFIQELEYLRLGYKFDTNNYGVVKLIARELDLGEPKDAVAYSTEFFKVNYANPRSMQDIVSIFQECEELGGLIELLISENIDNAEALANIQFHYGSYLDRVGKFDEAIQYFKEAKKNFLDFDPTHYVLPHLSERIGEDSL